MEPHTQYGPVLGVPINGQSGSAVASVIDGAFVYSATDFKEPGVDPIFLRRVYSSNINYNGPMGTNWDFNFNRSLDLEAGAAYYATGEGYKVQLNYVGGDTSQAQSVGSTHLTMKAFASMSDFSALGIHITTPLLWPGGAAGDLSGYVVYDPHGNFDIFDSTGRLVMSVNRKGNLFIYGRDTVGRLIGISDLTDGTSITFNLDVNGRILSATDSFGRVVSYTYDSNYNLATVTHPATPDFPMGTVERYGSDGDNRLLDVFDANGNLILENSYGGFGSTTEFNLVAQFKNGHWDSISYPSTSEMSVRDSNGHVTDFYNDGNGNITKKVVHTAGLHAGEPATYETNYTFDANNQMTQETDPAGNGTHWTYDSYGDVLTITKFSPTGYAVDSGKGTQVLAPVATCTYESRFHQVATMTDPNGNTTTFDYGTTTSDPTGSLLSVTAPTTTAGTAENTFTYITSGAMTGQVATVTTPDGKVAKYTYSTGPHQLLSQVVKDYGGLNATTNYTYDTYEHVATVQDPNGNTYTFTTNPQDEMTEVDGPLGVVQQTTYDAAGQSIISQKKLASGQWQKVQNLYNEDEQIYATNAYTGTSAYLTTSYSYDFNGNPSQVTDPIGHTTAIAYDERNLPYLKTDSLGKTTRTDFDKNGNTVKLTDELGHVTTYAYDGIDKLEEKTYADSSYETMKYDAGGRVTSERTTAGNTISQTYDARNELLTKNYGSTITNTYDLMGRLLTAREGGTSLTYTYDSLSRISSFTDQAGHESSYSYDLDGNRLTSSYPTGTVAHTAYDALNRPSTLKDDAGTTLATYSYDGLSRVTNVALGNGTSIAPGYDLLNRVNSVHNTLGTGNRNYSYAYDNGSRVTSITGPRGTVGASYDDRDELTGITEPSGSPFSDQSLSFDAAFNRTNWTLGTSSTTYTVNNLNQYTAIASATPTYNSDGELASYGGNSYTYDAMGRLTEVDTASNVCLYSYDPMGRRVKKVLENAAGTTILSTTSYHYDGSSVAVEYQPTTTWSSYGGVMRTDGTNQQWYYRDGQGSVSAVADHSGTILEAYEYTAQGQCQITNGSGSVLSGTGIGNDILYTGQRYDAESGNYFCNARYYNPQLGRFISRDPLGGAEFSQGTNLYAYCGNDGTNLTDPSGMAASRMVWVGGAMTSGTWGEDEFINNTSAKVSNVLLVTRANGGVSMPMTRIKNSAQSAILGLPIGTLVPIFVPPGVDPQALVNQAKGLSIFGFRSFWKDPSHNFKAGAGNAIFDAFGNFEYGATGAADGFSGGYLQSVADSLHGGSNNPINSADIQSGYNAIAAGGTLSTGPYP